MDNDKPRPMQPPLGSDKEKAKPDSSLVPPLELGKEKASPPSPVTQPTQSAVPPLETGHPFQAAVTPEIPPHPKLFKPFRIGLVEELTQNPTYETPIESGEDVEIVIGPDGKIIRHNRGPKANLLYAKYIRIARLVAEEQGIYLPDDTDKALEDHFFGTAGTQIVLAERLQQINERIAQKLAEEQKQASENLDQEEITSPQKNLVRQFLEGAHANDKLAALTTVREQLIASSASGHGHIDLRPETSLDKPDSHSKVRGITESAGKPAVAFTNNEILVDPKLLLISLYAGVDSIDRENPYGAVDSAYTRILDAYDEISGIWVPLDEFQTLAQYCLGALSSDEQMEMLNSMVGYSQDVSITNGLLKNHQVLDVHALTPSK